ncbi:GNAT family N-acetyltransferase [Microcoleus sp. FACHB-672]|uniref:GNAT family N-acetyltransferase n=1 Tax=Microcoleus sp. FACHB-672 TaxID=2692825 RepID=UPI0016877A54|nr:GNAT family N-acetyltransferase [Microcoleus sp. FACHB-672]MBD2040925.1 N-acetyltransferase [Microcoleus sp. FACHB-672]
MTIRDAVESDLPAIIAIYNASIPSRMATADLEPVSVDSRLAWFAEHSPTRRPLWVMEIDGWVAGWLSFRSFYGRPAYQATAELGIYVDPTYQCSGVGRQLLSRAIEQSPTLNLKTLLGFIFAHNHPSLLLFEKFGFQRWGYLPEVAELDGIERDLMIMGRKIEVGIRKLGEDETGGKR